MINHVSKDVTYFKKEKTFQNRGKAFQNQQNMFLIIPFRNDQKRVPKSNKMRSRSFHFGMLSIIFGAFCFLRKRVLIFCNALLSVLFFGKFFTGTRLHCPFVHRIFTVSEFISPVKVSM